MQETELHDLSDDADYAASQQQVSNSSFIQHSRFFSLQPLGRIQSYINNSVRILTRTPTSLSYDELHFIGYLSLISLFLILGFLFVVIL